VSVNILEDEDCFIFITNKNTNENINNINYGKMIEKKTILYNEEIKKIDDEPTELIGEEINNKSQLSILGKDEIKSSSIIQFNNTINFEHPDETNSSFDLFRIKTKYIL
jgi:hypothetical protein